MDQKLKKQLQDFERQLDAALDALPTRGWSGTSAPVSYTHLDVYKRQDSGHGITSM